MLSWGFGIDSKKFSPVDWDRSRQLIPRPELRNETKVDWDSISQSKKKDQEASSENKEKDGNLPSNLIAEKEFYPLTKLEYQEIVKAKRREQVHNLFLEELEHVFHQLGEKAVQMTDCHFEVSFDINETYDIDKAEVLLRDYFLDLEYDVIVAERGDERKVIFTLT